MYGVPKPGKYMAAQPWIKGYNGEVHFGPQNRHPIFAVSGLIKT